MANKITAPSINPFPIAKRCVLLLEFTWTRDKDPRIPLGHASILATLLRNPALQVHPMVCAVNATNTSALLQELVEKIMALAAPWSAAQIDLAIGAYVWGEALLQSFIPKIRSAGFKGRIILGGPQISYAGAGLEAIYPDADIFIRGYGEQALSWLARSSATLPVKGVHIAGMPDQQKQAEIDLESLPSPWLTGLIPLDGQRFIRWETQRGCPYRCAFCQHKEAGARLKRHALKGSRIFREIELFCKSGVQDIAVLDPIFNIGQRATDILRKFAEHGYRGKLSLQCRAESTRAVFLEAAAALDVTLEFGLQTIHDLEGRAIDRRNNIQKVDATLTAVREQGINHEVSLIFGLPHQSLDSFLASVEWCLKRRVPVIKAFPLMLLRGTALERDRHKWGLQEDGAVMPTVKASNSFSEQDWHQMTAISMALKQTEGNHPTSLNRLLTIAEIQHPQPHRWRPLPVVV